MTDSKKDIGCTITLHWYSTQLTEPNSVPACYERLDRSRSHRILWLLEELHIPYEIKTYKRGSDMMAPKELKSVHPLGKSPVVTIESPDLKEPMVLPESGLIVEYLTEHFGEGTNMIPGKWQVGKEGRVGGEADEWMRWRYLMHYTEGSLMGLLVLGLVVAQIRDAPVPFFIRPITRSIASRLNDGFLSKNYINHFDFLESQLSTSSGEFICGSDLTGADILLVFPLEAAREAQIGMTKEKYPKLNAYLDKLLARPAYGRAVQRIKDETGEYVSSLRSQN
ncbi:MAG: hypothetical protein M1828_001283 [Chrysothrix sp. TS-e1954]|nr:MAG: hypothetical protein M1828_001283 [Chrysothrix sp. TS-e1954]